MKGEINNNPELSARQAYDNNVQNIDRRLSGTLERILSDLKVTAHVLCLVSFIQTVTDYPPKYRVLRPRSVRW